MSKNSIRRGFESFFTTEDEEDLVPSSSQKDMTQQQLPIEALYPNPDQPRRNFESEALNELAESIERNGILQPILVRPHPFKDKVYEIIAGERRWQASQKARLSTVPVIIKELSDADVIEIALIENMHRRDLNVIEEAAGYKQLIEQFDYSQEKLAQILTRSRSHIANLLRLLSLPQSIQKTLIAGELSTGHVRTLVGLENAEQLAKHIIQHQLNVRQTENLVQSVRENPNANLADATTDGITRDTAQKKTTATKKDKNVQALEQQLSEKIGLNVRIKTHPNQQSGNVSLSYENLEDFDRIRQAIEHLVQND